MKYNILVKRKIENMKKKRFIRILFFNYQLSRIIILPSSPLIGSLEFLTCSLIISIRILHKCSHYLKVHTYLLRLYITKYISFSLEELFILHPPISAIKCFMGFKERFVFSCFIFLFFLESFSAFAHLNLHLIIQSTNKKYP